jgi:bacterioferritin-associated ferredoxin
MSEHVTDVVSASEPPSGARPRDAYLCFCEAITPDEFRARIAAAPDASFERICADTGVASKCTACLLNAENLFIETKRAGTIAVGDRPLVARHPGEGWSRQRLYRVVDALFPDIARTIPGIIPIVFGPGISTVLVFANTVPPVIGSRAPAFRVKVEGRDAEGRVTLRESSVVAPGGRLEIDISRGLAETARPGELGTGACFLSYRATGRGYLGSIRPHFKVVTPRAASSVHSAGGGRENAFIETCFLNPAERQYVSAVNCTDRAANVSLSLLVDGAPISLGATELPPRGARLIAVPRERAPEGRPFGVLARADREVRWHYLVAEGEPPRISLDHI